MNSYPFPLNASQAEVSGAVEIVRRLKAAGFISYWAGGCVRDLILGRPAKDFDIATNAIPDKVVEMFPEAVEVGKSFGVVRVPFSGHWYEVATFRKDADYRDGRHPSSVTFSDPVTDSQRRDFTVNALFYDPIEQQVIDYAGGSADIARRLIRAVGIPGERFREDHLRMLRAVRFAATLGFALDSATADAIRATAGMITTISAERIRDELNRLLTESLQAGEAVLMLRDLGLLGVILPEIGAMQGVEQPPEYHPEGDVFQHTLVMLNQMRTDDYRLAWAVLLHDVGKPPTAQLKEGRWRFECHAKVGSEAARAILDRLKFSCDDRDAITFMVGNHMRFIDVKTMRRSTLRRLVGAPTFHSEMELHRLDCASSHGDLENHEYLLEFRRQLDSEPVLPAPWVNGRDIMALGIKEGPGIGVWRKKAYDAQLEGTFPDRESLLEWLKLEIRGDAGSP
ncbi:MAG: CCA tRNA nucleotidyltransferase [bacterium]